MSHYYIGLLSGTSMDAIDAAIVDFSQNKPVLLACHSEEIPELVKEKTRALFNPAYNEIQAYGELDHIWGKLFAKAVLNLLSFSKIEKKNIIAIGSHGQSIRHCPMGSYPFSLQIGDPNHIAALTKIKTVADFRRMDMALGGQGAPLAPAFHHYLFHHADYDRVLVNIGGIANISYLPADKEKKILGFDTGPGNTLMDAWCQRHFNQAFDKNGEFALSGKVDIDLLTHLFNDPYFHQAAPKSTGPEYFNLNWLNSTASLFDTQRTLLELTALSITKEIIALKIKPPYELLICGGGAKNPALMQRLSALLGNEVDLKTTAAYGIEPDWLEAMLFAWLAKMRLDESALDLRQITGCSEPVILGGVYG